MGIARVEDLFGWRGSPRLGVAVFTTALLVPLAACTPANTGRNDDRGVTSPSVLATASTEVASVFPADDTTVRGAARFGVIKIGDEAYPLRVENYRLGTNLGTEGSTPKSAPVWRVDVARMPGPESFAASLGITGSPTEHRFGQLSIYEWPDGGLTYSPATSGYAMTLPLDLPANESSAAAAGRSLLIDRGLLAADSRQLVEVSRDQAGGSFSVTFRRRVGSLPVYGSGTTLGLIPDGGAMVSGTHRPLAGGSNYPLRSAAAAWADGIAGHWYMAEGILRGDPGVVVLPGFAADKVELCYLETDFNAVQEYLVPMYGFTDSEQHIRLFTPAVSGEYLSR